MSPPARPGSNLPSDPKLTSSGGFPLSPPPCGGHGATAPLVATSPAPGGRRKPNRVAGEVSPRGLAGTHLALSLVALSRPWSVSKPMDFIFLAAAAGSPPPLAPPAAWGDLLGSAVGSPRLLRAPPGPHRSLQLPPCALFNYFSQNKRSWRGSGGRAVVLGGPSATLEGQRWWHHGHGPTRRPQRWCPLPWVTTSHRRGSGGTGDTAGVVSPPPPHPRPSGIDGTAPKIPDPGELGASRGFRGQNGA